MSNQENGFQGSIPFVTDKEFQNMSLDEIRHILQQEKEALKKDYKDNITVKNKLIKEYKKVMKLRNKVSQGIDIKKENKKSKPKKIKTFDQYFEECIKNKKIPKDTPDYLRQALERVMYEHEQEIKMEKSALDNLAFKYIFDGIPGIIPAEYLSRIYPTLINFLKDNKNNKIKMILVCLMERIKVKTDKGIQELEEFKAYFASKTYENLESTNSKKLANKCIDEIFEKVEEFNTNGSGWYFKEVIELQVTTIKFNPTKGSSYIDLPKRIKDKKAIINVKNKDDKCFLWCILRYLHPKERDEERINDLKKYEFSLNTKGITFPMKVKDISKFEKLNPELPGINVFSEDDKMTIYPLKDSKKDCKNTIDLFFHKENGISHYSLIKNFHRLIRSQKTKSKDGKIFICKRCFMPHARSPNH